MAPAPRKHMIFAFTVINLASFLKRQTPEMSALATISQLSVGDMHDVLAELHASCVGDRCDVHAVRDVLRSVAGLAASATERFCGAWRMLSAYSRRFVCRV